MSKRKSQSGKIKGIYQRGNTFWYGRMVNGKRIQRSLETDDYGEAVVKALEIRAPEPIWAIVKTVKKWERATGWQICFL